MDTENKKSLQERILGAVKNGEIQMRPRWHFILKAVLGIVGGSMIILALIYLVSFIIFGLQKSGILFIPSFGFKGLFIFMISLPWLLILLLGVFIFILEMLVRKYSFAYRQPLLYSALAIVCVVFVSGIIIAQTPLHGRISEFSIRHHIPMMEPAYDEIEKPVIPQVHRGEIIEFNPTGFVMKNPRTEMLMIIITPQTRLPFGSEFETGDMVVVLGPREGNIVHALGVREISP